MKYTRKICLIAGTALLCCALICGCGAKEEQPPTETVTVPTIIGTKQPSQYTWEEYLAMTDEEKQAFQERFGSEEVFEAWMEKALQEDTKVECPWDAPGAKQPEGYSWEEFEALSGELQIAFQKVMGEDAFSVWMSQVQNQPEDNPWDAPGAKQPSDYTWAEFEALSAEHQIAFQNALGIEAFEAWMNQTQSQPEEYPWDKPGAKQPEDYTWEEFEALSAEHQTAFQNDLGGEAFEAWMNQAQSQQGEYPWEKPGAKQLEDYTWEEFEALSGEHQIVFQNVMGEEAFEAWLYRVNP